MFCDPESSALTLSGIPNLVSHAEADREFFFPEGAAYKKCMKF